MKPLVLLQRFVLLFIGLSFFNLAYSANYIDSTSKKEAFELLDIESLKKTILHKIQKQNSNSLKNTGIIVSRQYRICGNDHRFRTPEGRKQLEFMGVQTSLTTPLGQRQKLFYEADFSKYKKIKFLVVNIGNKLTLSNSEKVVKSNEFNVVIDSIYVSFQTLQNAIVEVKQNKKPEKYSFKVSYLDNNWTAIDISEKISSQ